MGQRITAWRWLTITAMALVPICCGQERTKWLNTNRKVCRPMLYMLNRSYSSSHWPCWQLCSSNRPKSKNLNPSEVSITFQGSRSPCKIPSECNCFADYTNCCLKQPIKEWYLEAWVTHHCILSMVIFTSDQSRPYIFSRLSPTSSRQNANQPPEGLWNIPWNLGTPHTCRTPTKSCPSGLPAQAWWQMTPHGLQHGTSTQCSIGWPEFGLEVSQFQVFSLEYEKRDDEAATVTSVAARTMGGLSSWGHACQCWQSGPSEGP